MNDTWTIQAALDWTLGYLANKGDENPRLSAQWLLSEATGLSRIELYAHFDRPLSMPERDILRSFVARRATGEPLQYITGEVGFRHIVLKVCPGVLIPRPETEVLVSEALGLLPTLRRRFPEWEISDEATTKSSLGEQGLTLQQLDDTNTIQNSREASEANEDKVIAPEEVLVADLCTGSGCVACSIAYEYENARVIATDIEPKAIKLAQENAQRLDLLDRIEFFEGDLGLAIPEHFMGSFRLVVSNPPYIPSALLADIPHEVSDFEPVLALDGGKDGLEIFRRIADWSLSALSEKGALVVELHEDCLEEASRIAINAGFVSTRIVRDLAERKRILLAQK